jgi:phytoene dehydrogenase-like protein
VARFSGTIQARFSGTNTARTETALRAVSTRTFDYVGDAERMVEQIRRFSPGDIDGYLRFVETSRRIYAVGFDQLADVPFHRLGDMLIYVLAPVPHLGSGTDWRTAAEPYRDRLYAHLERTCLPELRAQLVTSRTITPQHFHDELHALHGAAFSIQPVLHQSAYFRFHDRADEVANLYFVGAGTHPGAGMPGVLCSAKVVDRLIADRDGTGNPRDPIAGTHAA